MVENNIKALAKGVYDNLFNWLVKKMNLNILPEKLKEDSSDEGRAEFAKVSKSIGLLDIFGFECFDDKNQFEQLCINFVNEKLHNLYISSIFGNEKDEMQRQGLTDVKLTLPPMKVRHILTLLDNGDPKAAAIGIFNNTDQRSQVQLKEEPMPKRVQELYDAFKKAYDPEKGNPVLDSEGNKVCICEGTTRKKSTNFVICHSAKDVKYDMTNFIEANSDKMSTSLTELLLTKTGE